MTKEQAKKAQAALNSFGYDAGPVDGDFGKRSIRALTEFQSANGLHADGDLGPLTSAKLYASTGQVRVSVPASVVVAYPVATAQSRVWPLERDVPTVFGPAGGPLCTAGIVKLPFTFRLAWDLDEQIKTIRCHSKVAASLEKIFADAAKAYGEAEFKRLRLDVFSGCFNHRVMRGSKSTLSMHSWGIAVDLDDTNNQLRWGRDRAAFARPEYEKFWRIVESTGAISLGRRQNYDWMHFQFARKS